MTARARLASGVAALLLAAAGAFFARAPDADARTATGGSGRFVDTIDWLEWGTAFQTISGSTQTRTSTMAAGGVQLVVSCSLSKFTGVALAYRSGVWMGDGLDELYNIGGAGTANALVNGVATPGDNENPTATFDFACSATLGGQPFALGGIVFADAEQSVSPERVQATIASSATWRIIDRVRSPGCSASTAAGRSDDGRLDTLVLTGQSICAAGPAAVAYTDGATSGSILVHSPLFGRSAVALGVLVPIDRGDAPVSYGEAGHAVALGLSGGAPSAPGPTLVNDTDFALASPTPPPTRLGASVDPGGAPSAGADGDDTTGSGGSFGADDDETEGAPASIAVTPGAAYTRSVACTGPGFVAGWIDFDASGSFDGAERSHTAACTGSSAALAWTVPAGARAQARSFERVRIAASGADIAGPTGLAASGEVEDHALAIALAATPAPPPPPGPPGAPPPPPPPSPQPEQGKSVAVVASKGTVLVRVPGSARSVGLGGLAQIPLGSHIDARKGEVTVTAEVDARTGATQSAAFYDGIFVVTQTRGPNPILEAKLAGGSFAGCSRTTAVARSALGVGGGPVPFQFAAKQRRSKRSVRKLWGKGKGDFRTEGRRSSGTVRGTWWLVEDRCDGTYTRVRQGTVDVRDFRLHRTIRLRAGKRYLYLA